MTPTEVIHIYIFCIYIPIYTFTILAYLQYNTFILTQKMLLVVPQIIVTQLFGSPQLCGAF